MWIAWCTNVINFWTCCCSWWVWPSSWGPSKWLFALSSVKKKKTKRKKNNWWLHHWTTKMAQRFFSFVFWEGAIQIFFFRFYFLYFFFDDFFCVAILNFKKKVISLICALTFVSVQVHQYLQLGQCMHIRQPLNHAAAVKGKLVFLRYKARYRY